MKGHLLQFNTKIIVSGNVLEKYEYERAVVKGYRQKSIGRANEKATTAEQKKENRNKTASRARTTIRRTANANAKTLTKFLTLTFAENLTDIKKARYELDKFVKRVKYRFPTFEYIVVPEFQKRGAVHFHMLCNLPFVKVKDLAKLWKNGFIKLNRVDHVDNIGAYITKYITKDNIDERLTGKKCYSMSKGLKKAVEITDEERINDLMINLESVKREYTCEFESDYYGKIVYTQVICGKPISLKRSLIRLPDDTPTPFDSPK